MKKILMVCEALGGGVFTYVSQLCNDVCSHFEVYLAYKVRIQTPLDYKKYIDSRVHLIEVPTFSFAGYRNLKKTINELRKIENEIKPDIIHMHSSIAGGIGRIAFKGKNNVLIYTPHGYAHVLMGKGFKSILYRFIEIFLGHISNAITLTCCKSEDDEAKKISKKTAYIETGVNLKELSNLLDNIESKKQEKFTVYTLGRICVQKQPRLFNQIAQLVPDVRFVWIGSGELEYQLNAPNIEVTGWKPRTEALAMAKGADIFVLCSLGEAIAMSLIENMYIKKLVLVSNVMGNKSVIKNGVNGYVCDNAEEYAARIREARKLFPVKLTERAYQDVLEKYNAEVMKGKFVEFYNQL